MINIMEIDSYKATIQYDSEIDMFRGEFVGLNGGADFYAKDVKSLHKEGQKSLKVFFDMCAEDDVEPHREFSGKFNLRIPPKLHADIVIAATAEGKSLNKWVANALEYVAHV